MVKHRHDFEPFVEDDVPFDRHAANLAQPGTFAGNDAIVAFARNNQVNVVIHQLNNPLWQIRGTEKASFRELHIAYRYGEHYDSVRHFHDNTETPANLQTEMFSKEESNWKDKRRSNLQDDMSELQGDAVQKVRNATGCADASLILQSLEAESYNIESAILAILQIEELKHIVDADPDSMAEGVDPQYTPASWDRNEYGNSETLGPENSSQGLSNQKTQNQQDKANTNRARHNQPEGERRNTREDENKANGTHGQQKVSNKQRKEQQRQQKKRRQEERHRQKVQESSTDNNRQEADSDPARVTVVKALAALNI
ncbi:hypothetical protein FKM82_013173 [Ascaphus truei]